MPTLSVVIPAYNEEASIMAVAQRVLAVRSELEAAGFGGLEVIIVDDGSRDRTREIARGLAGVRLLCHKANGGYGAALKTGWAASQGDWIGFLDADGTYPPEYFPALCRAALAHDAHIVIGSRMSGARSGMPPVRRVGNLIFANLVSLVSAQRVTDSASGMRVFRREMLDRLYPLPDGLNMTPVMSTRALHEGLRMVEVPIPYNERAGRSKLSAVRDGMRFASSIVWTALTYNPARPLGLAGAGALTVSGLLAVAFVIARIRGVTELGALGVAALFVAAVLAVAGVSIFCLGATFNYLVALFYRRPIRQGLFGKPLFRRPLERHFGWAGVSAVLAGMGLGIGSLALSLRGWAQPRLWFWELLAAGSVLVGLQLVVSWCIMRALAELNERELRVAGDLKGRETEAAGGGEVAVENSTKGIGEWLSLPY